MKRVSIKQRLKPTFDEGLTFSKERVAAFGDAVIAIAITLLVLDIHPDLTNVATNRGVWQELLRLTPNILAFVFSFWVIARLWIGNQLFFQSLATLDMRTLQYYILFLFVIVAIPFPTGLLAASHLMHATIVLYAGTMAVASTIQALMWYRLLTPTYRAANATEYFVFYRVLQYGWSAVVFVISIPLAFIHPYVGIGFWVLFGFTRMFTERSAESLKEFEEVYLRRKSKVEQRSEKSP